MLGQQQLGFRDKLKYATWKALKGSLQNFFPDGLFDRSDRSGPWGSNLQEYMFLMLASYSKPSL